MSSKIGQKLKDLRKQKGWSQEELSKFSEVPLTTIAKIESGVIKNPSSDKLAKIAGALSVSMDDINPPKHSAGQANINGIKAQIWAAASLFFQYLAIDSFEKIELEAPRFEDFNLVFANNTRIIVEVKLRNESFSIGDLINLYEKLLNKGGINPQDEILIIAKNFTIEVKLLIDKVRYIKLEAVKEELEKAGFKKKYQDLLAQTKYWHVDFGDEEAKEVAVNVFSKLIDYGASPDNIIKLFDHILVEKFFEGSAKGNVYTKSEFYKYIQDEKVRTVIRDGKFDIEVYTLDEQFSKLQVECNKVSSSRKSEIFAENTVAAASVNPSLMLYALNKLETIENLDLSLVEPILNLNKNYQYSFSLGRILKKNLNNKVNINIVLKYLQENLAALAIIRADWFAVSEFIEIANKIIEFDQKYAEEIVPLIHKLIEKTKTKYLYLPTTNVHDRASYELGRLIEFMAKIFALVSKVSQDELFRIINKYFSLTNRNDGFDFREKLNMFSLARQYLEQNYTSLEEQINQLITLLAKDAQKGLKRFVRSRKFDGYELMSSISTWHGDEYSIEDKDFVRELMTPILQSFYEKEPSNFWNYTKRIMTSKVSKTNPDFTRRALIPILIDARFSKDIEISKVARKYLSTLLKDLRGIPPKSDLIFQIIYHGSYPDNIVWDLLEMSFNITNLPQNPFVEKITRSLINSKDSAISTKAQEKVIMWLQDEIYLKRAIQWHSDLINNLETLIEKTIKKSSAMLEKIISESFINSLDTFNTHEFTRLIRLILRKDFDLGLKILTPLIEKENLTVNEQVLLMHGFYSIIDKDITSEYLMKVYNRFVTPFLKKFNTIELICNKLSHAQAREVFIDIAEAIIKSDIDDKVKKGLFIISDFMKDPDPHLPGEDPEDNTAQYSVHKRILEGQGDPAIGSVRGKIAYALGLCIFVDGREQIEEILKLTNELILDKNYEVLSLIGHTVQRLGECRLWVMNKNTNELFLSKDKNKALQLAKRIETLAFTYLERILQMPELAQKAMAEIVASSFNNIRALNFADAQRFMSLVGSLHRTIAYAFAPYYIYYAFYRKDQFKDWKYKDSGLYDDLDPELFDESYFYNLLLEALRKNDMEFHNNIIRGLEKLLQHQPEKKQKIYEIIQTVLQKFNIETTASIFQLAEDLIESNFNFAFDIYTEVITVLHRYLNNKHTPPNSEELRTLRQLNFHYEIDTILNAIFKHKGEETFLKTLDLIFDVPSTIYMYQLNNIDDILRNVSKTTLADKIFKLLYEKVDPRYFDIYTEWRNRK